MNSIEKIKIRVQGAANPDVSDSLEWLAAYLRNSNTIQAKYLVASTVVKIITPLFQELPRPVPFEPLYRLSGSDTLPKTTSWTLTPQKITSFTYSDKMSDWKTIAYTVGFDNFEFCLVTKIESPIVQLTNGPWLKKTLMPFARKWQRLNPNPTASRALRDLDELTLSNYQKEVIGYSDTPIKVSLLRQIT